MPQVSVTRDFKISADGITLQCKLSAPPGTPTSHIEDKITLLERFVQAPHQISMEFDKVVEFRTVEITVADKPKTNDREFEFRIRAAGAPMTDRSTIYALAQAKAKITIKVVETDSGMKEPKKETKIDSAETTAAAPETAMPPAETADYSVDINKKLEEESTIDKAIREALIDKIIDVGKTGISDDDLTDQVRDAWKEPINSTTPDGFCFVAIGAAGRNQQPRLHIAEVPHVIPPINGKPAIQGAALIARIRELFNIPKPEKTKKGKRV